MAKRGSKQGASGGAINPLPSLIRAAAFDAANIPATKAGRNWSRADYNRAGDTQERLVRACYSKPGETSDDRACYVRFGIAEQLERAGCFLVTCNFNDVFAQICEYLDSLVTQPA